MQKKFSLTPSLSEFIDNFEYYGFKDKSSMVQTALSKLKKELELESLKKSADLYAEIYEYDTELQELTESAVKDWLK